MVPEEQVRMAYRLIFGREPENEKVVRGLAEGSRDLPDLRGRMFSSPEFAARIGELAETLRAHAPLNWPPMQVDLAATEPDVAAMMERTAALFRDLGRSEPYWSVVAEDRFRSDRIGETLEEFIASGQGVVQDFVAVADRCGIDVASLRSCCELGCGTGRSTLWLAELFGQVLGCDISPQHLDLAKSLFDQRRVGNVKLQLISGMNSIKRLPRYDAFFSIIVLQHNGPPVIDFLLRELLGKLNQGGVGYFQVPTYILRYSFRTADYLLQDAVSGRPEMHALPQDRMLGLIAECGCELLEIREDNAAGANAISNRLLVRKK